MNVSRFQAILRHQHLGREISKARASERLGLIEIGRAMGESVRERLPADLLEAFEVLALRRRQIDAWKAQLHNSLERDRADYARVGRFTRWFVVVRGLCDRRIWKQRLITDERELLADLEDLGSVAVESHERAPIGGLPLDQLERVRAARAFQATAHEERAALVAACGGRLWPAWIGGPAREARSFLAFLWKELKPKLLPRFPALIALVAAWWVTHAFTTSGWASFRESFGMEVGATVVSSHTKERLIFWIPILSAAAAAYLSTFIGQRIDRYYGVQPVEPSPRQRERHAIQGRTRAV